MTATGTAERASLLASAFRDTFRHHPTGVAVVTARDGAGGPVGLTASSVASVSLAPPALVVSVSHRSSAACGAVSSAVPVAPTGQAPRALVKRSAASAQLTTFHQALT